jgi:hypothetical protein
MTEAKLFILGQEIELLWTDMHYYREVRMNGKPSTEVMGGSITLCFATNHKTDQVLRWMTKESEDDTWEEVDKMEEGKVCFYESGFDYPPTKTYKFNDAHLIYFKEIFYANDWQPMETIITISPAIQNYGTEFPKRWNVSWIPPSERMPYQSTNNSSLQITKTHYEDLDGNKTEKLTIGKDVYLVIESSNILGKKIDIDLSDKEKDFIYKGQVLENDILKNLVINSNIQKEKLTIIAQNH